MSGKRKEENVGSEDALRDSPRETEAEGQGRPRYWLIGGVMLGLIAALIAGAFLLNERFRPRVGIEPAPSVVVARATPGGPAAAVPLVVLPSATVPPTAAAAPTPTVTTGPTAGTVAGAVTSPSPARTTPGETPAQEVEQAYQKYLQIYSDAVWNLDTRLLGEVLDGQALTLVTDEVNQLKSSGRPVKVIEDDRQTVVVRASDTTATLVDEYTSRSVYANPKTRQLLPRDTPPVRVRQSYEFRKTVGVWKIVDGTREVLGEVGKP